MISGIEYPLKLESELQGLHVQFENPEELSAWIQSEREYWEQLGVGSQVYDPSIGHIQVNSGEFYAHRLSKVTATTSAWIQEYKDEANKLELIIGQSRLGQRISQLVVEDQQTGTWMVLCLTKGLSSQLSGHHLGSILARQRAQMLLSPALIEAQGLATLAERERQSSVHVRETSDVVATLRKHTTELATSTLNLRNSADQWWAQSQLHWTEFEEQQRASLASLHDLYHKQLQTQAAAYFWKLKGEGASRASWWALLAFIAATVLPIIFVPWLFWEPIEAFIERMMIASNGVFTLTPVVVLTIPVLGYAWILRQISRIFLQNRTMADDAGYRRVMTMTFLGLTKDKTSGVTDTERAIILNALFRPTPPNTTDEGPPTGLLDILKSK